MITLSDLQAYLHELLQCSTISDYCHNGIQVEGTEKIESIATAVSADLATIQAAAALGVQALIVHHGLFWQRDSHVISGVKREKIRLLLEHNISLLAYHLPLDKHQELGNNWRAAKELGWTDLQPFGFTNGQAIGVKGQIGPISREALQKKLEKYYRHSAQCVFGGKEKVHSIALISGGAHKSLSDAIEQGVDCFLTGTVDEPIWHQAKEGRINFFALGHSATERIGPKALGNHLEQKYQLSHQFIDSENPF
jgi:dinuclear metal center YbgI/SA1388 family protein